MTLTAESFIGRIIAAFSRRSPGFRQPVVTPKLPASTKRKEPSPPPPPTPSTLIGDPKIGSVSAEIKNPPASKGDIERATARWKFAPADVRITHRSDLFSLANLINFACSRAGAVTTEQANKLAPVLADSLDFALDVPWFELSYATKGARCLEVACAIDAAATARHLDLDITDDDIKFDFRAVYDNLVDAASDFTGTDISDVNFTNVNLAWLRWNHETQWPDSDFAHRVRKASVEHPPGTGIFVVLPQFDHDSSPNIPA